MLLTARRCTAERILVVDDAADHAEALALVLRTAGFHVEWVTSTTEALPKFSLFQPGAVVTDLSFHSQPDTDGFKLASAMRSNDASIFLVALSGFGGVSGPGKEYVENARVAGFDVYLMKPAVIEELIAILR